MELQYQVGRLELENMELEQHRIVHESILKGKDLVIQKLKLQLAVRDKIIQRQQNILKEHELDHKVRGDIFRSHACMHVYNARSSSRLIM